MTFLKDEKVDLRKLSIDDDLNDYLALINDVENLKWVEGVGNVPVNREDLIEFIKSNNNLFLGIFDSDDRHIGNIQLSRINFQHRSCEMGIIMGREFCGKGYAKSACRLVIKHAFEMLNLHRIYLGVVSENKEAIKLYDELGFVKEGIEKDMHLYNFKYYDVIRYRMLEDEYLTIQNNIQSD